MKLILWEVWSYAQVPLFIYLFRRFFKRNIAGDILAGIMIGVFIEFSTEPLWLYHFKLTYYKDTPISVPLGWGVMFAQICFLSEKLYCFLLKKDRIIPGDKRIFIFDVLGGALLGFPFETIGHHAGIWDYNYKVLGWDWGTVPFFGMPYEALVGYMLLMLTAPSFVRQWQGFFEGEKPHGA
ncbi:MAG: hypothetical protein WCU88_01705 [Elusimicrobiota bacterium]|jgi:hypothetical protein